MKAWKFAVVTVGILCCGWALRRYAWQPYQCNAAITELTARTDLVAQTASGYDRLRRVRQNLRDLEPLRQACPTQVRIPMLIGANWELTERSDDALRSYQEALTIDQRPEIHVAIALVQLQRGEVDGAIDSYVTAARFAPHVLKNISSPEFRTRVSERLAAHE